MRRSTARVLPVDPAGRVLLLHGWDPHHPESPYWFTIGGAVAGDETLAEAGARELFEETGIRVEPAALGDPVHADTIEFDWGGLHLVQEQTFFALRVDDTTVTFGGHDTWELKTIDDHRWWHPEALASDGGAAHASILVAARRSVERWSCG